MPIQNRAFVTLFLDDIERARAFYRDVIGLPLSHSSSEWMQFGTNGVLLVLQPKTASRRDSHADSNLSHMGLQVDDVESEYRRLSARQVKFTSPPMDTQFGKHATFVDPEGNEIDLLELRPPPIESVTGDTLVNNIVAKHPETMEVFEKHGIRFCGGCLVLLNAPVHETAEYSGLNEKQANALVGELNGKLAELESASLPGLS